MSKFPMDAKLDVEEMDYETAYSQLESGAKMLESEENTLEQAISLFELGQQLVQRCNRLLDQTELRVRQITDEKIETFEDSQ